jgi:hypothetical protein
MHAFKKDHSQAILLSLVFLASALSFVGQHEMWRDELQAWLLARDSQSVFALFANLKYEYHQALWYLLLFPLTRLFAMPEAMQYLNVALATAAIYIMARYSPFSWLQKILLALSYFLFYEYALIARNYALTLLFIFGLCALFPKRAKHPLLFAVALFLLCHTSLMGLFFAIAFALTVLLESILLRYGKSTIQTADWQLVLASLIVVFGIGTALVQLSPPPDLVVGPWKWDLSLAGLKTIALIMVGAYLPLPSFELHFWRTLFGLSNAWIGILSSVGVLWIILLFVRFLRARPAALFFYGTSSIALMVFFYTKHLGELRHHGFLWISLICALWIYPNCALNQRLVVGKFFASVSDKIISRLFNALLIIHVIAASVAVMIDYRFVFSGAKQTAQFLRSNHLDSAQIMGDVSYATAALTAYLPQKPFFYPDAQRYGTFIKWDDQRNQSVNLSSLLRDSQRLAAPNNKVVLILNQPIEDYPLGNHVSNPNTYFEKIFESDRTILWDEHFYVYLYLPVRDQQK